MMTKKIFAIGVLVVVFFSGASLVYAVGIDSTNGYAWGENIGWVNFGSNEGAVDIGTSEVTGYAWGENIGWISLNCSNTSSCGTVNYKVSREAPAGGPTLSLTGYAWGENIGWISFNCDNTSSCATSDYKVTVNPFTGDFSGYAWGENIGWIVFNCDQTSSCGTVQYKVATAGGAPLSGTGGTGAGGAGGGGGGGLNPPPPVVSSTPNPSTTPEETPTTSPSPTPVTSETPPPDATPPPTTPISSPPPATPGGPPPVVTPGGSGGIVGQAIDQVSGFIDRISVALFGDSPSPLVSLSAYAVTTVVAIPIAVAAVAAVAQNEVAALTYHTLVVFGLRRKSKVWGTIYDSQTKHPIAFAKLQLLDAAGHVLETRFADRDGRYGFLANKSSLRQQHTQVSIVASKDGFQFPSRKVSLGVDFVVYDHVYFGGPLQLQTGDEYLNYNIPMDPSGAPVHRLSSAFGLGLMGSITDKLLNLGFILGLFILPLNYIWHPITQNLILLLIFLGVNAIRSFVVYRPYGVIREAGSGKELPFSLVTLNDMGGKRLGFSVSDERGRYFLPTERGLEYELGIFTPANVLPQRTKSLHITPHSYTSRRAWVTLDVSL